MPRLDPGFTHYMAQQNVSPNIEPSEFGWVWHTADENHELLAPFGVVHVTKNNVVLGEN